MTFPPNGAGPFEGAELGTPALRLRPARQRDIAFLRRLYRSTRRDELAATGWSEADQRAFCDSQFDLQHADWCRRFSDGWFLVVTHRSAPIGRLYVAPHDGGLLVVDIALLPQWRGRGVGAALLEQVVRAAGPVGVVLHVTEGNRAINLYQRLGFVADGKSLGRISMRWPARSA